MGHALTRSYAILAPGHGVPCFLLLRAALPQRCTYHQPIPTCRVGKQPVQSSPVVRFPQLNAAVVVIYGRSLKPICNMIEPSMALRMALIRFPITAERDHFIGLVGAIFYL